jgi:putative endonuclease
MENSQFGFYVVRCSDNTFYAGYAKDIEKRIMAHNAGTGAKYTKARRPVTLLYQELFETKQEAMKAEYAFKQLTRIQKEFYMQERGGYNVGSK